MFIWLPPMGIGIMAGIFGMRQIMRVVSYQRMVCRSYKKRQRGIKGDGTEERWNEEALELMPIMPLVKRGMVIGIPAGMVMDMLAYKAAEPLVRLSQSVGGAAGDLSYQNGSTPFRVALSLWGHGSLPAGVIAFAILALGAAMAVCGIFEKIAISEMLESGCEDVMR